MTSADVLGLYRAFDDCGITVWIDGGWAVDALLGMETRAHCDLDIAIQSRDVEKLRVYLESHRFRQARRGDASSWNFVMIDDQDRESTFTRLC